MAGIVTSGVPSREVNDRDPLLSDITVHGERNTRGQADAERGARDDTYHPGPRREANAGEEELNPCMSPCPQS